MKTPHRSVEYRACLAASPSLFKKEESGKLVVLEAGKTWDISHNLLFLKKI